MKGSLKKKKKMSTMTRILRILKGNNINVIRDTFKKLGKELREWIMRGMGRIIELLGVTQLYTVYTLYTLGSSQQFYELLRIKHVLRVYNELWLLFKLL